MNIDLLLTKDGEAGLISSQNLIKKTIGILFDTGDGTLTFEFADMDHIDLNIPVEEEFFEALDHNASLHFGSVKEGQIAQAYQVPLMFSDDPYRGELMDSAMPKMPLVAFNDFLKRCAFGQPVHRDDLENDEDMGCILGDMSPASLEFAPHLSRRHALEARPSAQPTINAPGMGLGGGSTQASAYRGTYKKSDDQGDD